MDLSPRRTRRQRKELSEAQTLPHPEDKDRNSARYPDASVPAAPPASQFFSAEILTLPDPLPRSSTNLSRADHSLLLHKQGLLRASPPPTTPAAISASLVFAQAEAGTAVCIHSSGLILTCSHCIAETQKELDLKKDHHLLFASGVVITAKCVAWDGKRDLALLQITAAQGHRVGQSFPAVEIAETAPKVGTKLLCVGHPGSEDLECEEAGVATGYDVLHVSQGSFRGYADGQDVHDNEEIGALMHNCWTYWGHSGAPLAEVKSGKLVGLHSSWDDQTGMRRGVGAEAVQAFLHSTPIVPRGLLGGIRG
ncbi:hypothetical protein OQA88_10996 [Cercophora sp. LCS_1]